MLPDPQCYLGYPEAQVYDILGEAQYDELLKWMKGQTMALCEGDKSPGCNHEPDVVLYTYDVVRFLAGERLIYD